MAVSLSKDQAQKISGLSRAEGRACLVESLGWPPFDEDDDPQHAVHLDYLYENLMFMVNKGFQWNAITLLFEVAKTTIQESIGKTLPDSIKLFNSQIAGVEDRINSATLKQYTDYFFSTFMRHFKLYEYVFTNEQERLQINLSLSVEVPTVPAPFVEAKDVDVYEYEQKYKKIEQQEEHAHKERFLEQEKVQMDDNLQLQDVKDKIVNTEPPLDREKILDIINSVASAQVTCASHAIQQNIQSTMEDLSFMLEKTALERPQVLGAPPRFKTKTPLSTAVGGKRPTQASREKSGSKSRLSTKGSKRS